MEKWLRKNLYEPLRAMEAEDRFWSVAVGLLTGLFPVPAMCTIVTIAFCRLLAFDTGMSAIACAVNMLVTPLEVLCIPVFAKCFAIVVGTDATLFTAASLQESMQLGVLELLKGAASMLLHACGAWAILIGALLTAKTTTTRRRGVEIGAMNGTIIEPPSSKPHK
jgi:hypothetical protein